MGEISDALKRANAEQAKQRAKQPADAQANKSAPERSRSGDQFPLSLETVQKDAELSAGISTPPEDEDSQRGAAQADTTQSDRADQKPHHPVEISREREGEWRARSVLLEEGTTAEKYRHFAIRLGRELESRGIRSVVMASALRAEGKTTTSCNLALANATIAGGRRTALVDLDLRRPALARYMGVTPEIGMERVLAGDCALSEARVETDLPSLDLYAVTRPVQDAHSLLSHPRLRGLIKELEDSYDLVIIDSAPVLLVPDVELIAPHVGGCVVVLRSRQTVRQALMRLLEILPQEKVLGTFLNDVRSTRLNRYQSSYYRTDPEDEEASD